MKYRESKETLKEEKSVTLRRVTTNTPAHKKQKVLKKPT